MIEVKDAKPGPRSGLEVVTRFAPSPTGHLHLGHAYSALFAWREATQAKGRFLIRIEDIDRERCRPQFEAAILDDLAWLGEGLAGFAPGAPPTSSRQRPRRQFEHMEDYAQALERLDQMGVIYPCFCTRAHIRAEVARSGGALHKGEAGPLYPGLCRNLTSAERAGHLAQGTPYALRLDVQKAAKIAGNLSFYDQDKGEVIATPDVHGDVVLGRKDVKTSYHLAVTLDDHLQGITLVTRGEDLFFATHVHRLLQALLGLNVPHYRHHELLRDEKGRRLAKRDNDLTLFSLKNAGKTPKEVRKMAGFDL